MQAEVDNGAVYTLIGSKHRECGIHGSNSADDHVVPPLLRSGREQPKLRRRIDRQEILLIWGNQNMDRARESGRHGVCKRQLSVYIACFSA